MLLPIALTLFCAAACAQAPQDSPPKAPKVGWTLDAKVTWHDPAPTGACTVQVWHYPSPTFGGPELLSSVSTRVGASLRVPIEGLASRPPAQRAGFVRLEIWSPSRAGGGSATIPSDADPSQPLELTCDVAVYAATTLCGRALDAEGRPIEGALVRPQVLPIHDDVEIVPTATDHAGRFFAAGSWITDRTRLTIEHPRRGHASRDLDTPKGSHTELGDMKLTVTHPRFLTLVYADRTPIARARVQLGYLAIETDAAGRAPLHHLKDTRIGFQLGGHDDSAYHPLPEGDAPFVLHAVRARLELTGPHAKGLNPDLLSVHVIPSEHGEEVRNARSPSELGDAAVYHQPNRGSVFAAPGAWLWIEHFESEGKSTSAIVQLATSPNDQVVEVDLRPATNRR